MPRATLPEDRILPPIRTKVATYNQAVVAEVEAAIAAHDVVVVGMSVNPHVRTARKALDGKGTAYKYLQYGGYTTMWRKRLAIKMWSGWPTFPMVFVKGTLIGGGDNLKKLIQTGEFDTLLKGE